MQGGRSKKSSTKFELKSKFTPSKGPKSNYENQFKILLGIMNQFQN